MKNYLIKLLSYLIVLSILSGLVISCGGGAKIQISSLNITPQQVTEGQDTTVEASLSNTGKSEGKYTAILKINDNQVDSKEVTLAPGENKIISFSYIAGSAGQYKIDLNGLSGTIDVSRPAEVLKPVDVSKPVDVLKPAEFEVISMNITPAEIVIGSIISVDIEVKNKGEIEGAYTSRLNIDGVMTGSKEVSIQPNTSQKLSLTANMDSVGQHAIEFGGISKSITVLKPAEFKVTSAKATPGLAFPGQEVTVEAEVSNEGEVAGSSPIELTINGAEIDSQLISLEAGKSNKVTFKIKRDTPGNYDLKVNDASFSITVIDLKNYQNPGFFYSIQYPSNWNLDDTNKAKVQITGKNSEIISINLSANTVEMSLNNYERQENSILSKKASDFNILSRNEIKKDGGIFGIRQDYAYTLSGTKYKGTNLFVKRGRYGFDVQGEAKEADWPSSGEYFDVIISSFVPPVVATGTYTDYVNGFSIISLPASWDCIETGEKTPCLVIAGQQGLVPVLGQVAIESVSGDITVKDYVKANISGAAKAFQNLKVVSEGEVYFGKVRGYSCVFTGLMGSTTLKGEFVSVIRGSQAFSIIIESIPSTFDERQSAISQLVNSFTLIEPKPFGVSRQDSLFKWQGDIVTLDPAISEEGPDGIISAIFSGLVKLDKDSKPIPDLAEKWEVSSDGQTYTFHLRENAIFQDGKPFIAMDVKYSWERACNPKTESPKARTYLGDIVGAIDLLEGKASEISGIKVIDDHTLRVTIDGPKPYFLAKIAHAGAFIVDKANVSQGGSWYDNPNGTGPFKLKQWTKGQILILERNDNYYLGPAKMKNVIFKIFAGVPMMMYENGEIDTTVVSVSDEEKATDPDNPLYKELLKGKSLDVSYLVFNVTKAPFDDVKVRQAFALALDMSKIIEVTLNGRADPSGSLLPRGMPGFNPELKPLPFDPAQAKKLISESKYGSSNNLPQVTLDTVYAVGPIEEAMVAMWKQNLGIDVKVEVIKELAEFYKRGHARDLPLFVGGWKADYNDPQNFLEVLFQSQSEENSSGYSNSKVDAALARAAVERDTEKRLKMYQDIEMMVLNDLPVAPLFCNMTEYILVKPYVKGIIMDPFVNLWMRFSEQNGRLIGAKKATVTEQSRPPYRMIRPPYRSKTATPW
jgi:oligopeptide transport system substrate-binding protein